MALFTDEIRKSAGNAGIKTFTSKLDQGLMADSVTRGKLPEMFTLFYISLLQTTSYLSRQEYSDQQIYVVYCQENDPLDIVYVAFVLQSTSQSLLILEFRRVWE